MKMTASALASAESCSRELVFFGTRSLSGNEAGNAGVGHRTGDAMKSNIPKTTLGWIFHFAGLAVFMTLLAYGGYIGEPHEMRKLFLGSVWLLSIIAFAGWLWNRHVDKRAQPERGDRELNK